MSNFWTPEQDKKIAECLADGMSASQIAAVFGCSRNAIVGMVHRNRELREIGFARSTGSRKAVTVKDVSISTRPRKIRGGTPNTTRMKRVKPAPVIVPEVVELVEPSGSGLPLHELSSRSCRWCINDPAPGEGGHLFCAEVTEIGRPYCAFHYQKSIGKGTAGDQGWLAP